MDGNPSSLFTTEIRPMLVRVDHLVPVTSDALNVDSYSAMCVQYAKSIFDDSVIAFELAYCEKILAVEIPEVPPDIKSSFLKVDTSSTMLTN